MGKDFQAVDPGESYAGAYLDYVKSTVETHMLADLERLE